MGEKGFADFIFDETEYFESVLPQVHSCLIILNA